MILYNFNEKPFATKVRLEAEKAVAQHGNFHSYHEAYGVLLEEVDEFWELVRMKESARKPEDVLAELVQIGAMAQKAAESLGLISPE